jgi:hypothetical protein
MRMEQLHRMGIANAAVLSRLNRHRNEVEHEYALPTTTQQLEDLIDAVDLFVHGTAVFSHGTYDDLTFIRPFRSTDRLVTIDWVGDDLVVDCRPWGRHVAAQIVIGPLENDRAELMAALYQRASGSGCIREPTSIVTADLAAP